MTWVKEEIHGYGTLSSGTRRSRVRGSGSTLVVERTFGWLNNYRRLSKDYEELTESSETLIHPAMSALCRVAAGTNHFER
ncbi:MAG: transposase [Chloroflexota bacterium]